jgi:hypothetical protein
MRRAGLAVAVVVTLCAVGVVRAQPTPLRPPGQTGQNISIDCDIFADGVHEVPIIVVTTPAAGATVPPAGDLTLQGVAVDCHVEVGAGINRVSAYLGQREAGGIYLGDAALRRPNPITVLPADQYGGVSGWILNAKAPLKAGELNDLFIYARSEMTQRETSVRLPLIGAGSPPTQPAAATPIPTDMPAAVPPASNAPPEAIVPAPAAEPTPAPADDNPPASIDGPPAPVDETPVE